MPIEKDTADECASAAIMWTKYANAEKTPTFSRGDSRHWAATFAAAALEIRQLQAEVAALKLAVILKP